MLYINESLNFSLAAAVRKAFSFQLRRVLGGGALAWGPWVQRVIFVSSVLQHYSWKTDAGYRQCGWEFMLAAAVELICFHSSAQPIYIWKSRQYVRTQALVLPMQLIPLRGTPFCLVCELSDKIPMVPSFVLHWVACSSCWHNDLTCKNKAPPDFSIIKPKAIFNTWA